MLLRVQPSLRCALPRFRIIFSGYAQLFRLICYQRFEKTTVNHREIIIINAFHKSIVSSAISRIIIVNDNNEYIFQEKEFYVAVGGGAIIFAVLTLLCAKFITIVSSSIVGSAMIIASIDFFMHGSQTLQWVSFCCLRSEWDSLLKISKLPFLFLNR